VSTTTAGIIFLALLIIALAAVHVPLGDYMYRVYTSDDVQGSGLGLAIARELAERMEGHLAVESVPGRTTFTLELPA